MLLVLPLLLAPPLPVDDPLLGRGTTDDFLFGNSLAAPGDVNGDGCPDVAIGQRGPHGLSGCVWLVSGRDGAAIRRIDPRTPDERFGHPVAAVGDLDGDGIGDLAVGVESRAEGTPPRVELVSGAEGLVLFDRELPMATSGPIFLSLAALGDLDLDGVSDFVVGLAPDDHEPRFPGAVLALSGADGAVIHANVGARGGDRFGEVVSLAGDADGDGVADYAASAGTSSGRRYVRVMSGATGSVLHELGVGRGGVGPAESGYGASLAPVGDVDCDGHDDLAIGSYQGCEGTDAHVRVQSGRTGGVLRAFRCRGSGFARALAGGSLDEIGSADLVVGADEHELLCSGTVLAFSLDTGRELYAVRTRRLDRFGAALSPVGDVDGDGLTDFVAGTDHAASRKEGCATLVSGGRGEPLWTVTAAGLRKELDGR